jgi:eukaryotic-like serine/threonine-protein kinase
VTAPDRTKPPLPVFDGVQIIEKLGSGPLADLYHAVQQPLGRPVLIKALSSSILPSSPFAATLEREARLLAELHHSNILRVHDFVRRDDRMWLVLEFVDGWTLSELLEKTGSLQPSAAAAIGREIARALEHAHARGIVHRDVQPKNVLVSRSGQVKLVNFSVAVGERLPTAPELLDGSESFGGPHYMSPEQILGEPADPRSDLFSLGVVLYELLSARRPFDAPDERTTTQRIRHDAPIPLSRLAPAVPSSLERAIARCLEKMPSDRFFSASELALALDAVLADAGGSSRDQILRALADAGLVDGGAKSAPEPPPSRALATARAPLQPAVLGLILCSALIIGGGVVLQWAAWREGAGAAARGRSTRLELAPAQAGFLRVVAEPWAHVIVDGQRVETTPFARAIPLPAGTHYVRLEHPNARTERRTVQLAPGETVLLDVKLEIDPSALSASTAHSIPDAAADGPPPSP